MVASVLAYVTPTLEVTEGQIGTVVYKDEGSDSETGQYHVRYPVSMILDDLAW